jgi:hypothetical protein
VLNAPAGKRLAPMLAELVPLLRRHGELDLDDVTAALLVGMSAATIDRKLAPARARMLPRGRSHTKPGSMLKSKIAMRTWADPDEDAPGFVEVDLVAHEGGNAAGRFCFTLTVTDIATGWTENRTVPDKRQVHVVAAITEVVNGMPFPVRGIDCDNGGEFINDQLYRYCREHKLKFTRSRSGNKNDGAHEEQKNWTTVRQLVGYLRIRPPRRAGTAEQDLGAAVVARQPLLPPAEADLQGPRRREDHQEVRPSANALRPRAGPPHGQAAAPAPPDRPARLVQPRRRPETDPGPQRRPAHPGHRQEPADHQADRHPRHHAPSGTPTWLRHSHLTDLLCEATKKHSRTY